MPGELQPCSGKGECSCGRCSCHIIDSVLYSGKYCEECSTCTSGKCEELRDCVQCKGFRTGPLAGAICNETCTIKPKKLQSLKDKVRAGAKLCTFLDEKSGCDFNFTYKYLSSHRDHVVYVQKLQQCPPAPDVLLAVLCAIGAVVAIGTLTLILWKIFTTIHDRKEFEKFEKERNNVQWGTENSPLYKPATDTFVNPAFGNRSSRQSKQEETTAQ
uniref:Integrin beta-PS-like n=2 Tax=Hirondellea gigas TaxID=1518452 RepID=A0A6A7FZI7_9CRUS